MTSEEIDLRGKMLLGGRGPTWCEDAADVGNIGLTLKPLSQKLAAPIGLRV